jgi:arylformamidase
MIDITVPLRPGMDVWEGDPPFEREPALTIANDGSNVSKLTFSSHAGSHIDAPYHFFNSGSPIDELPLDPMIGECQVIFIPDSALIGREIPADAIAHQITLPRLLLKTSNSEHPGIFSRESVALSLGLAELLIERGVRLIGVDGFSVENASGDGSVHRVLLSANVIVVETLDLSRVDPGRYELLCLPLKIVGCDAAPLRAVLRPLRST